MATGVDSQLLSTWNAVSSDNDWRLSSSTVPPPPIPVRSYVHNRSSFATPEPVDSDAYLSPLSDCHHFEAVILPVTNGGGLCPPLPPRQPLQRSMSLTHRPPPNPADEQEQSTDVRQQAVADMVAALRLARSQRPVLLTPAASAPLLSQVVPISRWPIPEQTVQQMSPVRVIPLARWPLVETAATRRLAMDGIVSRGPSGNTNEYVEGPSSSQADGNGHRRRARRKVVSTPHTAGLHTPAHSELSDRIDRPVSSSAEIVADRSRQADNVGRDDSRRGFAGRMRRMFVCGGSGSSDAGARETAAGEEYCPGNGGGGGLPSTVCRRCGQCRCPECLRAEESSTLCRARTAVDTLTCMCCVRSVFYHCTKDDAGQDDDCSDAPCACCERPHCVMRWTVMALLLPCLPCLCLYPPLSCSVDALCRRRHASRACRCTRRSRSSGLKGLLESESSSA